MNDTTFEPIEDEIDVTDPVVLLEQLKQKADTLGITYSSRIGLDALRAKVEAAMADPKDEVESVSDVPKLKAETKAEAAARFRQDILMEEMRLIRVRITNLNPSKKELTGEIFTVANKFIGIVKKFVPYGEVTDDGYHIPNVIYKQLKEREFLSVKTRTVNGQIHVEQRWAKEFALEVLDQLDQRALDKLAAAQAASAGGSN